VGNRIIEIENTEKEFEMVLDIGQLENMAADLLDLTDNGWDRTIYYDLSKLAEEVGEVAETLNKSKFTDEDTGEELSDVILVCLVIALKKKIDLNKAIISKQGKRLRKLLNRHHNGVWPEDFEVRYRAYNPEDLR
jgi:NTP pyrophosphatase (non-canonical NTP hydrolase)